jgi:penicillin amidase
MATAPHPDPSTQPRPRPWPRHRRIVRALLVTLGLILLVVLAGGLWLRHRIMASLPRLRGELALPGLGAPVRVERDALGVPTLRAATRLDAARALGFVHAQDRFFQMDVLRRESSGELAELFGSFLQMHDENRRRHDCRGLAARVLAGLPPAQRALLDAYVDGVNAGLGALGDKPFEYVLLRAEPRPWQAADSILVIYAMYFDLQDWRTRVETEVGVVHDHVPAQIFDFVEPEGSEWDAPLAGVADATPPIPGPEVLDRRRGPRPRAFSALTPSETLALASRAPEVPETPATPATSEITALQGWAGSPDGESLYGRTGSNSWAVAGSHTADGHALVADDMHLGIQVPNIWYRASWAWRQPDGEARRVTGVTLAGAPLLVAGSTGRIAWGFTNSFVDLIDLVDLELDPRDAEVYRTPAGPRRFEHRVERIRIHGKPDEMFDVARTIWGPVVDWDEHHRPRRAIAWTADLPAATNMEIFGLEAARNIDEAIEVAHASGIPAQNFVVADASGRVGWTIIGKIPRRIGWNGQLPSSWADGSHRWDGWLRSDEVPKVVDPPSGRIWSANNRAVGGPALALLGDGSYDLGPRARQIRDRLLALERATPRDLLAIQLDDQAIFLTRWHDLLLRTLTPEAIRADPRRTELRRLLATTWTGRASIDSVAYRVVREFRDDLEKQVFDSLTGLQEAPGSPFYLARRRFEGPLWRLVTERPAHLLDPRYATWDAQLLAVADAELRRLEAIGPRLADRTWGERNTMRVEHPLGLAVPLAGRWLSMPAVPLSGDLDMPKVIGPMIGASERMVVSPGHEETGIFHMPVGESGNPLSPHFGDGHAAWVEGRPTPFLPGPAVDILTLTPHS